jgi:hypothetical protein
MATVYCAQHRESGALYVGCSKHAAPKRWKAHEAAARRHPATRFHFALAKHGAFAFEWWVVKDCASFEEALAVESDWIRYLREQSVPLYNTADGGRGVFRTRLDPAHREAISRGLLGHRRSDDTRLRMSLAQKGRKVGEETRRKLRGLRKGVPPTNKGKKAAPLSEEAHRKLVEAMRRIGPTAGAFKKGTPPHNKGKRGAKHSDETRRRMSEAHKGKPNAGQFKKGQSAHNKKYATADEKREARLAQKREWYRRRKAREFAP